MLRFFSRSGKSESVTTEESNRELNEKFDELKLKLAGQEGLEHNFTDVTIARFLRGRKLKVDDALKALVDYANWRKANAADQVTADMCSNIIKKRFAYMHGKDKVKRPVLYNFVERFDRNDRDITEVKNFIIYTLDGVVRESPETEQLTLVYDMTNFSIAKNMDFECVHLFLGILQNMYPELLGAAYFIKVPYIFRACFEVIKPWMDPVTASKVSFIQPNELLRHIDRSELSDDVLLHYASYFKDEADAGADDDGKKEGEGEPEQGELSPEDEETLAAAVKAQAQVPLSSLDAALADPSEAK